MTVDHDPGLPESGTVTVRIIVAELLGPPGIVTVNMESAELPGPVGAVTVSPGVGDSGITGAVRVVPEPGTPGTAGIVTVRNDATELLLSPEGAVVFPGAGGGLGG